ncbi:MAG: tRNA lysidine(34) synthetase TilS [Cyanobacteria bacterium NC_groundwater_1444_Ag_S-0.65um_54_12]|nr:tRNA lysidine(34) synthetase TilS [Cyanobacteria bacterium NC_groundwater_1444_Ag_S-0.65um_54_12]
MMAAWQQGHLPPAGQILLVGFSGGPDSSALLHALTRAGNWSLVALHIDHGLRAGSANEAEYACQLANRWQVPCHVVRLAEPAVGETAARKARHLELAAMARQINAAAIALGHNADDQLETMLLNLIRGAGLTGLSGMQFAESGPAGINLVRPLLGVTRQAIEAYLHQSGIQPLLDPTNEDPAYTKRNRLRLEVLPVLRSLNPRVAKIANRTARILARDEAALETATDQAFAQLWQQQRRSFRRADFNSQPISLRYRMLRRIAPELSFAQAEQLLGFAGGQAPAHTHLLGKVVAIRSGGELKFRKAGDDPMDYPGHLECRICLTRQLPISSMGRDLCDKVCQEDLADLPGK